MRHVLAAIMIAVTGAAIAAGCSPPVETAAASGAAAAPLVEHTAEPVPDKVRARVDQLRAVAETGSYRDMARLADDYPGFRSNEGGLSHKDYWYLKLRAGDWPMEQMKKVLAYPPAIERTAAGVIYVWPYMARLDRAAITTAAARDIDALAGAGQAEAMRAGGAWAGYSLGVQADGAWLFFISGAG